MKLTKKWASGIADETRKIAICSRDASRAEELIGELVYILTDAGADTDKGIIALRSMSGDDIINGLLSYRKSALTSIQAALSSVRVEKEEKNDR